MKHPFSPFENQNYLNMETYRKSGQGVKTPVWFAQEGDTIYVRTFLVSGKVKRVRKNGHIRLAPCKNNGELLGDWVEAYAEISDEVTAEKANQILNRKYGMTKRMFDFMGKMRGQDYCVLVVKPIAQTEAAV